MRWGYLKVRRIELFWSIGVHNAWDVYRVTDTLHVHMGRVYVSFTIG
jgi:hypothetical protein